VIFQVYGSIDDYSDGQAVKSELTRMVGDVLLENGVTMPYPRQDVYLKQ
jgi:small-conductance mechanosensitive channel